MTFAIRPQHIHINLQNATCEDTVHATFRISSQGWTSIRKFFHIADNQIVVQLPHGITIRPRGRGWYRIEASNSHRAVEKIRVSLPLIRKAINLFTSSAVIAKRTEESTKMLERQGVQPIAWVNGEVIGEVRTSPKPRPAITMLLTSELPKLEQLRRHFGH